MLLPVSVPVVAFPHAVAALKPVSASVCIKGICIILKRVSAVAVTCVRTPVVACLHAVAA